MKTAYLDIETSYDGTFTDQRLFKDYKHHRITVIGVRILDGESDAFIQLVGSDVTRANLMLVLQRGGAAGDLQRPVDSRQGEGICGF